MADYRILHDDDRCVKCGLCVAFCPCNVLEMKDEGFPYGAHPDQCVGCQTCSGNCPQRALTIEATGDAVYDPFADEPRAEPLDKERRAELAEYQRIIMDKLDLRWQPVAVSLVEADELLPNVVQEIPVGDIDPNTEQPRRSFPEEAMTQLSASVKEQGILQPLLVVEQPGGRYRIVAGERRWRAARQAGLATVPCIVRDMDMIRQMEVSLIENLQREDLNPMEEAAAIRALMQQCGYTQETVAARLSKSRPVIANLLRLLTLPKEVAQMVREGQLSAGHARVLAGLDREEDKIALARETLAKGYSVRQLEQLAALRREAESHGQAAHKVKNARPLPPELKELEGRVRETLGMRATLSGNAKKGKIVLQYYSQEELERLYEVLEKLDTL